MVRRLGSLCLSFLAASLFGTIPPVFGEIPLPELPDWESNPNGHVATGLGVADLDRDGWVDLVVANGNDIYRQELVVYRNRGDGTFPDDPTWISSDVDYHGHLDLADVDGDGRLDCAVAVYLGVGGFGYPGRVKLYRGNGDGTFSPYPVWESGDAFYCFSVAFGDLDMDGAPDLACAAGDDYYNNPGRRRVYRNVGGELETLPSWTSTEVEYSLDVVWADFDGDGALDLAFAGTSGPNRIYFSQAGTVETTAGWSSSDGSIFANTAATGDYDGDGWIDLAIADNSQLGGTGRAKIYRNLGNGTLATTPIWQSNQSGYGSHVSFVDIDEDGDLDLAHGRWWGPVRIYENLGGTISPSPAYASATSSVIENEVWEDVDNDGLQLGLDASWTGDGGRRLFYLPERPARRVLALAVDGVPVDPAAFSLDADDAWIILPQPPAAGVEVRARYVSSGDLDLAVSNWDSDIGQYLFYNERNPVAVPPAADRIADRLVLGPNPSTGTVRLSIEGKPDRPGGTWEIFDAAGRSLAGWASRETATLWDGRGRDGEALAAGVYWVRWSRSGSPPLQGKVIRR